MHQNHFEAAEANLVKAERLLAEIEAAIPEGIAFAENPDYETNCRNFRALIAALPKIDGWKPLWTPTESGEAILSVRYARFVEVDEVVLQQKLYVR